MVGIVEYATRRLLIFNEKVLLANEIKPYFRVNSLFYDPNIYGRFLAVTMVAVASAVLWRRTRRDILLAAVALAVMWAGLVVSLSESSFAALLFGLVVLAALAWRPEAGARRGRRRRRRCWSCSSWPRPARWASRSTRSAASTRRRAAARR